MLTDLTNQKAKAWLAEKFIKSNGEHCVEARSAPRV